MISLKFLVDKEKNRVIFAESDEDFIDVVFSFLTLPMGTIIRLISSQPPTVGIGCMTNLYESIKNLDVRHFRTEGCKTMLLCPRNGASPHCERLKLQVDNSELLGYFLCKNNSCSYFNKKLLSLYSNAVCQCGERMEYEMKLSGDDTGVFVKELTRFIISDELQVKPPSTEAALTLLSKLKLGPTDGSTIEERHIDVGVDEVLTLLKCSLVSKTPLTETLLKNNLVPDLEKEDLEKFSYTKPRMEEPASDVNGKIHAKLIISKSRKMVCYAEASEDFVDLLCSFLTVPLGYIVKEMHSSISKGSINQLYNSVEETDAEKYLKSDEHKTMLVNPKLAPDFGYENHPLGIEEHKHPPYYYAYGRSFDASTTPRMLTSVKTLIPGNVYGVSELTVVDPKSGFKKTTRGGFVKGPARFTVTDNLIITPISPISSLSLLNKLNVPVDDIEERVVQVGHVEALRLMVASFVSESVLTNVFLSEPIQNKLGKS